MQPFHPSSPARAALALALLAFPALAGCGSPGQGGEILGSTSITFAYRPYGAVNGVEVVWTVRVVNQDNATSAPATWFLQVKSSVTRQTTERTAQVAALPGKGSAELHLRTPYDGLGDYSGTAELRVGKQVVARALVFFEQCVC